LCLGQLSKRSRRFDSPPKKSVTEEDLERVIQEQASLIESLKKDNTGLAQSLASMESERNRAVKENVILRKAVSYQQEREKNLENVAKDIKTKSDERIKALEHMILTLRYHLQAQNATIGNDFMSQRPPDVY
jgi:septal ring factor EnvC (AmiA/AmiB activator)